MLAQIAKHVLRGVDPALERLWAAIEPVVCVLPVLEGSDAWIRQGVGPRMRNGPRSRKLWGTSAGDVGGTSDSG